MLADETTQCELVDLLRAHEAKHGVTAIHHAASKLARPRLSLYHPHIHDVGIVAAAVSPSGRWLATASPMVLQDDWDAAWARGGVVAIWDVLDGRCVNVLDRIPGGAGALRWHESETCIGVSLGAHGVARFNPFARPGEALISSISEGDLPGCYGFDGSAPAWCWIPGSFDVVLAQYIVTLGDKEAVVRKKIEDDVCNFRSRVSAYDGIITDGHFTIRADNFERVEKRPLSPDFFVGEDHVIFHGCSGRECRVEIEPLIRYDAKFSPVASSHDGSEFAVLARSGRVVRYGADGERRSEVELPWADGILLGVDGLIIAVSSERMAFVDISSKPIRDISIVNGVEPHPLGEDVSAREKAFRYDPAFQLGSSWVVALETGEVAAPPEVHGELDQQLSFSLDRTYAWPLRWLAPERCLRSTSVSDLPIPPAIAKGLMRKEKKPASKKGAQKEGAELTLSPATLADVLDQLGARMGELDAQPDLVRQMAFGRLGLTEAAAGRGEQAVEILERALQPSPYPRGALAVTVAFAADLLSRAGVAEKSAVDRLATMCDAIPSSEHQGQNSAAAVVAHLARARHRLGELALARRHIEEAILRAPTWTMEPVPYAASPGQLDEAAVVAKLLVSDERPDEAMKIIRNLGGCSGMASLCSELAERGDRLVLEALATVREVAVAHERAAQALLRTGHYELFDELMPTIPETSYMKPGLAVARRTHNAISTRDQVTIDALVTEVSARLESVRMDTPEWQANLWLASVASGIAQVSDAGMDEVARRMAEPLSAVLEHARNASLAWHEHWGAIGALARAGVDVAPWIERAMSPPQKLRAIHHLLPHSGERRAAVLALVSEVGELVPKGDATLAACAAAALSEAGELERAEAMFSIAVNSADKDDYQLGSIAEQRFATGGVQGAWACLQLVPKARRADRIDDFLRLAATGGRADVVAAILAELPTERLSNAIWSIGTLAGVPFDAS